MKIKYKKVFEHDVDFLIIEEFICNQKFAKVFLDKIGLGNQEYAVVSAAHSLADGSGESDITILIEENGVVHGILIEDKIDAITMPKQSARYVIRGESGVKSGVYADYFLFLCAPQQYILEHKNDKNAQYPNCVSYEELLAVLENDSSCHSKVKAEILKFALDEKKGGYCVKANEAVTAFWRDSVSYLALYHPNLHIRSADIEKGAAAVWFDFEIPLKSVELVYKADKGYVDLQFSSYGERTGELLKKLSAYKDVDMTIAKAGKSASLRLQNKNWIVDFKNDFRDWQSTMEQVFSAAERMFFIASQLNYKDFY